MKRILKKRILVTLIATILAACCGVGAGYLLGSAIALRLAEGRLNQFAESIQVEGEKSSVESRVLLATLNASPWPYCSEAEIAWFRTRIYRSEYLQDAGRMRNGRIDCSAALGHPAHLLDKYTPDYSQQDGTLVYRNIAPLRIGGLTVISLQLGNSFVTFRPFPSKHWDMPLMHYTVTVTGASQGHASQLMGGAPQAGERVLTREGVWRLNGNLYATRCSAHFFNCFTAYMTIPASLQASRGELKANIVLGGLTGALLGIVLSIFYRRNRSMEQQLRQAIRKDKLRVEYQQIVSLASRRIVGAEALVRWTDEDGFAVGPDVFVKIAEERGFVDSITRLVVRHVLRDFAATLRSRPDFRLSINVAATDLADPLFLPMLESALKRAEVQAESLIIELTESSTARHEAAIAAILRLHQRGHRVHVDDFGTGYSSLSYLHDLSVDAIKIDRSFTRTIGTEAITVAILPQILAMAEALNLQVIAEGIETSQQAEYFAAQTQPILGQGWLFGRAVPSEEFHRLLAESEKQAQAGMEAA
jgi:sensor c-di-GMP phosphodiesterase-like protein